MQLSGTGIWSGQLRYGEPGPIAEAAAEVDELGFDAIWIPDVGGDVLGAVETLLDATKRTVIATGILNVWMHEPAEVAARRASWNDDRKHRFLLGLGVSHAPLIDQGQPGRYTKPLTKMVRYLDDLDAAEVPFPVESRVLAALRPRMLGLARDRSAGIHPYFVPPEHVARARDLLGADPLIAVELAAVIDHQPLSARATARRHTAIYVGLPNYTNNLREFGYGDDDFAGQGSDRLVDAIVAWGNMDAVVARVQAMRDAGADHVCVQVIRPDNDIPLAEWRELASSLVG
ncbi:MAG: LLM class F420-dependent oxidoreductase [Acidimicrobiia bacterium]